MRVDGWKDGQLGVVDVECIQRIVYLAHTAGTTHTELDTRNIGTVIL